MGFEISCNATTENTGQPLCKADFGRIIAHVVVPRGMEIATEVLAKLLATWTALCQNDSATRIYPMPEYFMFEPANEDDVYETGDGGQEEFVRAGSKAGTRGHWVNIVPCFLKKLRSLNDKNWAAFTLTDQGYILGKTIDGVKFLPINTYLRVEKQKRPTGDETWKTPIKIYDIDPEEWDNFGVAVKPTAFAVRDIIGEALKDVVLAVSDETPLGFTVTVTTECDNYPVTGLVAADFVLLNPAGGVVVITTVTEGEDGVYAVVNPALPVGVSTVDLNTPDNMTTDGYESTGAQNVTTGVTTTAPATTTAAATTTTLATTTTTTTTTTTL